MILLDNRPIGSKNILMTSVMRTGHVFEWHDTGGNRCCVVDNAPSNQ